MFTYSFKDYTFVDDSMCRSHKNVLSTPEGHGPTWGVPKVADFTECARNIARPLPFEIGYPLV